MTTRSDAEELERMVRSVVAEALVDVRSSLLAIEGAVTALQADGIAIRSAMASSAREAARALNVQGTAITALEERLAELATRFVAAPVSPGHEPALGEERTKRGLD